MTAQAVGQEGGGSCASPRERVGALASGFLLAVAFLKWGNPVILDALVARPRGGAEWLWLSWPVAFGYVGLALAVLLAVPGFHWGRLVTGWRLVVTPGLWLGWVILSAVWTVDTELSRSVVVHFVACLICFWMGWLGAGCHRQGGWFWGPVTLGFVWVLYLGFGQHYGGLEQTRQMLQSQPGWESWSPEFLRRIESNRVFSTLFYANTLASLIVLVLPGSAWNLWQMLSRWPRVIRASLTGAVIYAAVACLYWSGSKGGWLAAAGVGAFLAWHWVSKPGFRVAVVLVVLTVAVGGLALRFKGYFERGATSAIARVECWEAALQVVGERPWTGSGPGTFGVRYAVLKRPGAEMSRLVHNDYLQQASDSGLPAFLLYIGMIGLFLVSLYRKSLLIPGGVWVYAGLLGWCLHSVVEFGLYIPAIAWTAFMLAGRLVGGERGGNKPVDMPDTRD